MFIGLIFTALMLAAVIASIFYFQRQIKDLKSSKYDRSEDPQIINTQDLLPFKDIYRNRIDLGDHRYVAYLEVEPYNYRIQSEEGKDAFAILLRQAINSIPFRFQIFTHTQPMVNEGMLNKLQTKIDEAVRLSPKLRRYGDEYYDRLSVMNINNPSTGELRKVKSYYIVVVWEPEEDHNGMDYAELDRIANTELESRLRLISESLNMCGITTNFLTTEGILDLLGSIYRREESESSRYILNEEYLSQFVKGDYDPNKVSVDRELDIILRGAINSVDQYIKGNVRSTVNSQRNGMFVSKNLNKIRRTLRSRINDSK